MIILMPRGGGLGWPWWAELLAALAITALVALVFIWLVYISEKDND